MMVPERTACKQAGAVEREGNVKRRQDEILNKITMILIAGAVFSMLSGCTGFPVDPRRDAAAVYEDAAQTQEEIPQPDSEDAKAPEEQTATGLSEEDGQNAEEASGEIPVEEPSEESPFRDKHLKLTVTDPGYDVYSPPSWLSHDYKYGPSIINRGGGCIDAWFASPGNSSTEYDHITYMHSADGGQSWSGSKVVLCPTPDSMDRLSVCDPDVFYYDGYYYMGYTSTVNEVFKGFTNSVFIARSQKPDGPFEKWNGKGWGGNPYPLVYFDGPSIGWGAGEPAFVVKDDTVYIYTTMDTYRTDYTHIRTTEVRCALLSDELWPGRIDFAGFAVDRTDTGEGAEYIYSDCDSWDVVYLEEYDKFLAICANRRFSSDSCLLYYESDDGVHFTRLSELSENVICGCHNSGIMGDEQAHIKKGDPVLLGYAYSGSGNRDWGAWLTRFAPASIEITDEIDRSGEEAENLKQSISYGRAAEPPYPVLLSSGTLLNTATSETGSFYTEFYWMDSNHKKHYLKLSDVTFSGYDDEILVIKDGKLTAGKPGETSATVEYEGLSRELAFCSLKEGVSGRGEVVEVYSPVEEYGIALSQPYCVAVRPFVRYANYEIKEVEAEQFKRYGIEVRSENEDICIVRDDAVIVPLAEGMAYITVTLGELSYTVKVVITG